jgi:hypothetical protein
MKRINQKMMAGSVMMAFLTLGAGGLHAQLTNLVTITATAQVQGTNSYSYNTKTHVGTYTYAAPTKVAISTKQLLTRLALAENTEGNYTAGTTFPSGAKLVAVNGSGNGPDFQVLASNSSLLVDVSDLLTGTNSGVYSNGGNNSVYSGKYSYQHNVAVGSETDLQIFSLNYNDVAVFGDSEGLEFSLSGLATSTETESAPNSKTLAYTATQSIKLSNGAGDGFYKNSYFIVTGGLSASGSAKLTAH